MLQTVAALSKGVAVATGLGIAATVLGRFGRFNWFFELFSHFPIQLGLGLLLCAIGAWLSNLKGRKWLSGAALAFGLVNGAVAMPQLTYLPTAEARTEDAIRVVHVNINHRNDAYESALDFFHRSNPDILIVQEVDAEWRAALAPMTETLPHAFQKASRGRYGITIMSRYPLRAEMVHHVRRNGSVVAEFDVDGQTLLLVSAHPFSPVTPRRTRLRDDELDAIAALVRSRDEPTVLIGDLNTTPWSHAFETLVSRSGLRDSSRGVGYQWSWPAPYWPLAIPIDHCLVSDDLRVLDRRIGSYIGSDHRPLVVDLALR